jgi:hypothetical protein
MPGLRTSASIALALTMCIAHSQDDPFKRLGLTYAGYLDGYYQYSFGRPGNGDTLNGRGVDIAHNRATLSFAEIDLARPTSAKSPFGFTLNLYAGKGPELLHLTEPGGRDKYRWVRQAYVTYAGPVTVDLGKFDTWIGYEAPDNRFQDQYSRSFNWTYSEPVYETGVRATGNLTPKLKGSLFVVRGWNEVEDGNRGMSVGAAISYAHDANTTFTLQNHYGTEGSNTANDIGSFGGIGFANAGTSTVHLIDFIASRQISPKTKIGLNVDYASSAGGANSGNWNGEVLYLKHQINETQVGALRFERFEDSQGLRTGSQLQLHSLTGSFDWSVNKNATLRFELRHDLASVAFFNANGGPAKNRTTALVAGIVKF